MDDIDREFEQHRQAEKQRWFDSYKLRRLVYEYMTWQFKQDWDQIDAHYNSADGFAVSTEEDQKAYYTQLLEFAKNMAAIVRPVNNASYGRLSEGIADAAEWVFNARTLAEFSLQNLYNDSVKNATKEQQDTLENSQIGLIFAEQASFKKLVEHYINSKDSFMLSDKALDALNAQKH